MAIIKAINKYTLGVASHPKFNEWQANIQLKIDNISIADVRFVDNPDTFASSGFVSETGISLIYVHTSRYPWFVDMLRNEKPLFAVFYVASGTLPPRMVLQTGNELIGETEPA